MRTTARTTVRTARRRRLVAVFAAAVALAVVVPAGLRPAAAADEEATASAVPLFERVDEDQGGPPNGEIILTDCLGKERSGTCAAVPGAGNTPYSNFVSPKATFLDARRGRRVLYAVMTGRTAGLLMPRGIAHIDLDSLDQTEMVDLQDDAAGQPIHPELDGTEVFALDTRRDDLIWGSAKDWGDVTQACSAAPATCVSPPAPKLVFTPVEGGESEVFTFRTDFAGERVAGVSYDHERDAVYAVTYTGVGRSNLAAGQAVVAARFNVHEIGRNTDTGALEARWSRRLTMCYAPVEATLNAFYPVPVGFGSDENGRYIYVPCQGVAPTFSNLPTSQLGAVSQYTLTGVARLNLPEKVEDTQPTQQGGLDPRGIEVEFHPFAGDLSKGFAVDNPVSKRLTIVVAGAGKQRLYVFDAAHRAWVGSVPLASRYSKVVGFGADALSGRVYVLDLRYPGDDDVDKQDDIALSALDSSALPVTQGARRPAYLDASHERRVAVDPVTRRFFIGGDRGTEEQPESGHLHVFLDISDPYVATPPEDPDAATHDIEEDEATTVTYTGGASGYGARARLIGGFGGGAFTALSGDSLATFWNASPPGIQALRPQQKDEGLTLADVSDLQVTGTGAKASARGIRLDENTETNLRARYGALSDPSGSAEQPPDASKCSLRSPSQDCLAFEVPAERSPGWNETNCNDLGNEDDVRQHEEDGSRVTCTFPEEATAAAVGSSMMAGLPVQVSHAESSAVSVRDPERGIVTTVTSVARGITMVDPNLGALYIDEVLSEATTWAKGRPDSAGSDFDVSMYGVRILDASGEPAFACGLAGSVDDEQGKCDPAEVVHEINERFAFRVQAEGPRRELANGAAGSPGGARSLVQKDAYAWLSDKNVNGDTRPEVAGLTLTFYNDGDEASRLIVQLAGVAAESQYTIGAPPEPVDPGSLVIELLDGLGEPLAGGLFEVRNDPPGGVPPVEEGAEGEEGEDGAESDEEEPADTGEADGTDTGDEDGTDTGDEDGTDTGDGDSGEDGDANSEAASNHEPQDPDSGDSEDGTADDGSDDTDDDTGDTDDTELPDGEDVVDDVDGALDPALDAGELIEGGTCVTAEDGIGDCSFEDLKPGSYVVTQTAAPAGYAVAEPFPVVITPGFETTVSFTNLRTIASIEISLTDPSGSPLAGGVFVAYADDGDQALGEADKEHGRCTTGAEGSCGFDEVPLGDYVVHQETAPAGMVPAADVGFTLDQPEQVAELTFVNAPPPVEAVAPAGGFRGGPDTATVTITQTIRPDPIVRTQRINAGGGGIFGLPADVASFIARNPRQALLIAAVWLLFALPAYLAARRRTLALVKDVI